jgi:cysteinyl-tRNA synthetase
MHHGLLTINAQKMSKSLGNFVTIQDFIGKYGDCDLLKLFFLGTHYAHPVDYNEAKIEEMRKQKNIFEVFFDRVNTWGLVGEKKAAAFSDSDRSRVDALCARFEAAMDDDFNTPQALASLFELTDAGSQFISSDKKEAFKYIQSKLAVFWGIFGISIPPLRIPDDQMRKIREMVDARKRKDFATADRLREELKSEGYIVTTTPTNLTVTALRDKPRG